MRRSNLDAAVQWLRELIGDEYDEERADRKLKGFRQWQRMLEADMATPSPQPNLRVKPLEWKAVNEGFGHGRMHYGTGAFGHWYGVKREKVGLWSCVHHVGGTPVYLPSQVSLDEAKSAAQADYDERLSAALDTPSPQPNLVVTDELAITYKAAFRAVFDRWVNDEAGISQENIGLIATKAGLQAVFDALATEGQP